MKTEIFRSMGLLFANVMILLMEITLMSIINAPIQITSPRNYARHVSKMRKVNQTKIKASSRSKKSTGKRD